MKGIRWSQRALLDLAEISDHYAGIAPAFAVRVEDAILHAVELLLDAPRTGAAFGGGGIRKWSVAGMPYIILHRPATDGIGIARIHHARADWRGV